MPALDAIAAWPVDHAGAAVATGAPAPATVARWGSGDRPFGLASVTKALVAYACLVAIEEGSLDLASPAGPPGSTVRHLLAHASGLPFDGDVPVAAPGTRRVYSNTGFEVLGRHLEATTGLSVDAYLAEAVLVPLAMAATHLDGSPAKDATGTVDDLARFAAELLAPTLVAPETLATAVDVAFPDLGGILPGFGKQTDNAWGLGFERRAAKHPHWTGATNSPATFGHFGGSGTLLWVDPVADTALVVLTDRPFDTWAAERWPLLADAVLAEHGRGPTGGDR